MKKCCTLEVDPLIYLLWYILLCWQCHNKYSYFTVILEEISNICLNYSYSKFQIAYISSHLCEIIIIAWDRRLSSVEAEKGLILAQYALLVAFRLSVKKNYSLHQKNMVININMAMMS